MTCKHYAGAYLCALVLWGLAALPFTSPTYFDSFYYFNAAESLAGGKGLTDQVLWNYLDDPPGLPRPSHLYWMPLSSLLAAAGIALFGSVADHWRSAQAVMLLPAATIVPLAMWLSWSMSRRRSFALSAGLLALFSGNYLGIWAFADSYGPWALSVSAALLAAWRATVTRRRAWWLVAGLACGAAHLTRADGALVAGLLGLWAAHQRDRRGACLLAGGYLALLAPWCLRNLVASGNAFPVAGARTIWLRDYPEIFSYGIALSPQHYFSWGVAPILLSKLEAALRTLEPALGAWPILGPLAAFGIWAKRADVRAKLAGGYWLGLWLAMVLVFTFPAQRGSLYHSMAALVPWQAALVPEGIDAANRRIARRWPRWQIQRMTRFFLVWLTALACIFAVSVCAKGMYGAGAAIEGGGLVNHWQDGYRLIDDWLAQLGVPRSEPVVVTDPPIFAGVTGRRAVVLPLREGAQLDFGALDQVAQRFGAHCLALEGDPAGLFARALAQRGWFSVHEEQVRGDPIGLFCLDHWEAERAPGTKKSSGGKDSDGQDSHRR